VDPFQAVRLKSALMARAGVKGCEQQAEIDEIAKKVVNEEGVVGDLQEVQH
jgi:hypothetical protein